MNFYKPDNIKTGIKIGYTEFQNGLQIFKYIFYSLPIQLLILHIRKNQLLLVLWVILYGIITNSVGVMLGIPTLFLEPEYLNEVNFWSYFILGVSFGIFTMAFHITAYILDAPRFSFLGQLRRPFMHFTINNIFLPMGFGLVYYYQLYQFLSDVESNHDMLEIIKRIGGFLLGFLVSYFFILRYFIRTNKDIVRLFKKGVDKNLRRIQVVRVNVFERLEQTRQSKIRVDYYLNWFLAPKKVPHANELNSFRILKVFDQNHFNAVVIQLMILVLVIVIGFFRDNPVFQIPASASLVLLFTIILMVIGALSYWLRGWTVTFTIILFFILNFLTERDILSRTYEAYGLDYQVEPAEYFLKRIKKLSNDDNYLDDHKTTLVALENWRSKFPPDIKPKMVFLCVSGGGQRAAVWAMRTLQIADSTLNGDLMRHTILMTGASGGMVGAAYFRELYLQKQMGYPVNIYRMEYLNNIAKDNLNAIMFSLVVNDIFFQYQTFDYGGYRYQKDRGHAFEQQFNSNTSRLLDKPLCEYKEYELLGIIPMMILAPTIVNDGRKLYISPMNISYMTTPTVYQTRFLNQKVKGIEFLRFFEEQNASNLRFLTALRMSATFPYVTPNIILPSNPEMEIMDAGISDNFGVSDAIRFMFTFKNWINENTSGVVIVSIRDTQKDKPIERNLEHSLLQRIFTPLSSLFTNLEYVQDIKNDNEVEFSQSWLDVPIHRIEFQYVPVSKSLDEIQEKREKFEKGESYTDRYKVIRIERAALSWRLTQKEKESIIRTIYELRNQFSLRRLDKILHE